MTDRDAIWLLLSSDLWDTFQKHHPVDAGKVLSEWRGTRRPTPTNRFARGLVELIRNHPRTAPAPVTGGVPEPFALARNPRGGIEDIHRMQQAGLRALMLNAEYSVLDWQTIRGRADALLMPWGWWFHARTVAQVDWLLDRSKGTPFVGLNIEAELETTLTPRVLAERYALSGTTAKPVLIAYGWIQNNVRFTGQDCAGWPLALEMFPADAPALAPPRDKYPLCVQHARALGHTGPIMQLAQCYAGGQPGWYDRPYNLYTVDDAMPTIEDWV